MKVVTILGTRPEIIKMSSCIERFDKMFSHTYIYSGQNYDPNLSRVFFDELGARSPDINLEINSSTPAHAISDVIRLSYDVLSSLQPDAVVLYGDTNTTLACISAKRLKIPIFHCEAGNRCGDLRTPEEINRRIVDHTSDVNIVLSENARLNLLREGVDNKFIYNFGSHLPEVIRKILPNVSSTTILNRMGLTRGKFILVSLHREENVSPPGRLERIFSSVCDLAKKQSLSIVLPMHPRTRNSGRIQLKDLADDRILICDPLCYSDYLRLQCESLVTISDSGTALEESAILDFPVVVPRTSHERPEAFECGNGVLFCPFTETLESVMSTLFPPSFATVPRPYDYRDIPVSFGLGRLIPSMVPYINDVVWKK